MSRSGRGAGTCYRPSPGRSRTARVLIGKRQKKTVMANSPDRLLILSRRIFPVDARSCGIGHFQEEA